MSIYTDAERERAQRRFVWLQVARLGGAAAMLFGIAIANKVLPGPWLLGVVIVLAGFFAFFFGPPLLARRFKARDTHLPPRIDGPDDIK